MKVSKSISLLIIFLFVTLISCGKSTKENRSSNAVSDEVEDNLSLSGALGAISESSDLTILTHNNLNYIDFGADLTADSFAGPPAIIPGELNITISSHDSRPAKVWSGRDQNLSMSQRPMPGILYNNFDIDILGLIEGKSYSINFLVYGWRDRYSTLSFSSGSQKDSHEINSVFPNGSDTPRIYTYTFMAPKDSIKIEKRFAYDSNGALRGYEDGVVLHALSISSQYASTGNASIVSATSSASNSSSLATPGNPTFTSNPGIKSLIDENNTKEIAIKWGSASQNVLNSGFQPKSRNGGGNGPLENLTQQQGRSHRVAGGYAAITWGLTNATANTAMIYSGNMSGSSTDDFKSGILYRDYDLLIANLEKDKSYNLNFYLNGWSGRDSTLEFSSGSFVKKYDIDSQFKDDNAGKTYTFTFIADAGPLTIRKRGTGDGVVINAFSLTSFPDAPLVIPAYTFLRNEVCISNTNQTSDRTLDECALACSKITGCKIFSFNDRGCSVSSDANQCETTFSASTELHELTEATASSTPPTPSSFTNSVGTTNTPAPIFIKPDILTGVGTEALIHKGFTKEIAIKWGVASQRVLDFGFQPKSRNGGGDGPLENLTGQLGRSHRVPGGHAAISWGLTSVNNNIAMIYSKNMSGTNTTEDFKSGILYGEYDLEIANLEKDKTYYLNFYLYGWSGRDSTLVLSSGNFSGQYDINSHFSNENEGKTYTFKFISDGSSLTVKKRGAGHGVVVNAFSLTSFPDAPLVIPAYTFLRNEVCISNFNQTSDKTLDECALSCSKITGCTNFSFNDRGCSVSVDASQCGTSFDAGTELHQLTP